MMFGGAVLAVENDRASALAEETSLHFLADVTEEIAHNSQETLTSHAYCYISTILPLSSLSHIP